MFVQVPWFIGAWWPVSIATGQVDDDEYNVEMRVDVVVSSVSQFAR